MELRLAPSTFLRGRVHTVSFPMTGAYIELCSLLKAAGLADSGARGKHLVAQGRVLVDGQVESRKTAKIRCGQVVECLGTRLQVVAADVAQ
jgi:ribosome-associated protein